MKNEKLLRSNPNQSKSGVKQLPLHSFSLCLLLPPPLSLSACIHSHSPTAHVCITVHERQAAGTPNLDREEFDWILTIVSRPKTGARKQFQDSFFLNTPTLYLIHTRICVNQTFIWFVKEKPQKNSLPCCHSHNH
jgi:hypothetical protein